MIQVENWMTRRICDIGGHAKKAATKHNLTRTIKEENP